MLRGVLTGIAQQRYDSMQSNAWYDAKDAGRSDEDAEQFAHWWAVAQLEEDDAVAVNGASNRTKSFERSFKRVMKDVGYDLAKGRFKEKKS